MTTADTLRFDLVDQILLIVHADVPPSDTDWKRLIVVRDANRQKIRGTLVVAPPRASINAAQRADVVAFMRESRTSIAVMTDSVLVRGVAGALGLMGVKVQAFSLADVGRALDSLGVARSKHPDMSRRIEALKAQLSRTA